VTFEMMVLCGGLGMVLTWLVVCGLYPGKTAVLPAANVTDDAFVLEIQEHGPEANAEVIRRILQECNASSSVEREGA
jgi:hypothetical protein